MALLENPNYSDIAQALGIDVKGAKEKAFTEGLLGSIFQAAALSGPQPRPMNAAQALGQVGLAGYQGYKSAFDDQLKEALTGLQLKEALRKSQEAEALRKAIPLAFNIQREPAPTTGAFEAGQGLDVMQGGQGVVPERAITGVGINRQMLPALMSIPGGIEAVKNLAETQKLLRQSGLAGEGGEAPSPFFPYLNAQSPQVRTLAQQLNTAFKSGLITEEDAYRRLEPLAKMEETFVSKQGGPREALTDEMKIRSSFRDEPVYKAHQEMQSAYNQITEGINKKSPAGDLAAATKFMKLLDPGSVVRESELYMAMKASGALDRAVNYAEMTLKGTKLTPTQRADFQQLADKLYASSVNSFNTKRNEYAGIAISYGLNPERSVGAPIKFSIEEARTTASEDGAKKQGSLRQRLFPNR